VVETHTVFFVWDRNRIFKQYLYKCQASKGQCRQWHVLPGMLVTKFVASLSINLWGEISDIMVTKVLYRFKSSWRCVSLWRKLQRGSWLNVRLRHHRKFRFIRWLKARFIRTSRLSYTPPVYSGYPKLKPQNGDWLSTCLLQFSSVTQDKCWSSNCLSNGVIAIQIVEVRNNYLNVWVSTVTNGKVIIT